MSGWLGRCLSRRAGRSALTIGALLLLVLPPSSPVAAVAGEPTGAVVLGVPHPEAPGFAAVPPAPSVSAPTGTTSATTPTFQWTAVSGPVIGYYVFDLGPHDAADLGQWYPLAQVGCPTPGSTCSAASSSALPAGSHRFLVVGYNDAGWGAWSSPTAYCIEACSLAKPAAPVVTAPTGTLTSDIPKFAWSKPAGTVTQYAVYDLSAVTGTFVSTQVVDATAVCPSGDPCSTGPSQKLVLGQHFLFVAAMNAEGWGPWSAPQSYCISGCGSPFNSEFDADASGWTAEFGTWSVAGGLYYGTGVRANYASASHVGSYGDVDYRVKLARRAVCPDCQTRIIIRGTPSPIDPSLNRWNSSYEFGYTTDGSFDVVKRVGATPTILQTTVPTSAVSQQFTWNVLRVLASGPTLAYYINDVPVWVGTDTSLTVGQVGVNMLGLDRSEVVYVDYAHLTYPSPAAQATLANTHVSPQQQALNDAANRSSVPSPNPIGVPGR